MLSGSRKEIKEVGVAGVAESSYPHPHLQIFNIAYSYSTHLQLKQITFAVKTH